MEGRASVRGVGVIERDWPNEPSAKVSVTGCREWGSTYWCIDWKLKSQWIV